MTNFNAQDSAFPIQTSSTDATTGARFVMDTVGGMTLHEYATIEIFKALMTNPALVVPSLTADKLRGMALDQAAKLLVEFSEIKSGPVGVA